MILDFILPQLIIDIRSISQCARDLLASTGLMKTKLYIDAYAKATSVTVPRSLVVSYHFARRQSIHPASFQRTFLME
jgi:hypothetical protein